MHDTGRDNRRNPNVSVRVYRRCLVIAPKMCTTKAANTEVQSNKTNRMRCRELC